EFVCRHVIRPRDAPHRRFPRSGHGRRARGPGALVGPRTAGRAVLRVCPQPGGPVDDAVGRALAPDRARRGAPALRARAHPDTASRGRTRVRRARGRSGPLARGRLRGVVVGSERRSRRGSSQRRRGERGGADRHGQRTRCGRDVAGGAGDRPVLRARDAGCRGGGAAAERAAPVAVRARHGIAHRLFRPRTGGRRHRRPGAATGGGSPGPETDRRV
ncbi:MAG: hypothetical protein AVDCRST_MAG54-3852, partial [uncultured Actinomycetospora sp.]